MNELLRQILFLPEQASSLAAELDALHYVVISVTMLGATAVAVMATWYILRYRARRDSATLRASGRTMPAGVPFWLEFVLIGGLLTLFSLFWVVGYRQFIRFQTPPAESMPVYGTGKQWMWAFAYPNGGGSKGVLYVPVNRPVKLLMTSRDVIHSIYIPAFRVKQDVIPGRMTTVWFTATRPGRYDLFCTEYCGLEHSRMRATVVVLPEDRFQRHMKRLASAELVAGSDPSETGPPDEPTSSMVARGQQAAAEHGCLRCHTVDGTPHIGPTWAGLFASEVPLARGGTVIADEAYLTASMMDPMRDVHSGFPAVMPSFQGALTAVEAGALVEYIRSLRDAAGRRQAPLPLGPLPNVPQGTSGPFEQETLP